MALTVTDIESQVKDGMRAGDKMKVSTLRMLLADLKNTAVAKRAPVEEMTEEEILEVVGRQIKRRVEASEEFRKAGRDELAEKESAEAELLKVYMPEQLSEDEVRAVIREAIAASGAAGPGDMGKVMGQVMPKLKGKADGKMINEIVRAELAGS